MKLLRTTLMLASLVVSQAFAQDYKLVWSDEFNGTSLDASKWSYEIGNGGNGWGNNELEYYTSRTQNCNVQNGYLTVTAQKESYDGYSYTSARIKTQGKFSFKYGKIEARIKLPYGKGMWPAFWMLGDIITTVGWPACGENDIMEMVGGIGIGSTGTPVSDSTVYGTLHWNQNGHVQSGGKYSLNSGKLSDGFHLFGAIWTPQNIQFYVDSTVYYEVNTSSSALSAFQNKFFIILNLAVGGNWPGNPDGTTVFPQTMQVDYVRVYQDTTQDTTQFPTVSMASPQNNSTFNANSNITLSADASTSSGKITKVEFYQDAMKIGQTFVSPFQMNWNNVFPGSYRISSVAYSSTGFSAASDTVDINVTGNAATSPYGGTPAQVPGTIEAENYDLGGQGNAYSDSNLQNNGGQYRPFDAVDIEACSDTGGSYDVGWTQSGEWLLYTIDVSDSGIYEIGARVAAASASGALYFEIDGTDVTGVIPIPNTGGWQTWTTVQSKAFGLTPGIHQLKLHVSSSGFNINKFYIYPPNTSSSLNLLYPNGGEELPADSIVEIKWKSQMVDQVEIGFSSNGVNNWSLIQSGVDAGFGVYRWKVPSVSSSSCKLLVMDQSNTSVADTSSSMFSIGITNSIIAKTNAPKGFLLKQNFPNPFNPSTNIGYQLLADSFVTLKVYDVLGRKVRTLVDQRQEAGSYSVTFSSAGGFAFTENGDNLPSGVYFYRLDAGGFTQVKKMLLMK